MFSTIATNYITLLTDDNINNLYFPDLYKVDNLLDSTEDLKLIHLSHLRNKINEFKFDNTCNTIQRIQFPSVRLKWKELTNELCEKYGRKCDLNHDTKAKDCAINEYKKILKLNAEFIINNKDKIIIKIDELYLEKYDKKNEYECNCGAFINKKNKIRHETTMKHIKYLVNKEEKQKEEKQ
jgi:hypothetical protein